MLFILKNAFEEFSFLILALSFFVSTGDFFFVRSL